MKMSKKTNPNNKTPDTAPKKPVKAIIAAAAAVVVIAAVLIGIFVVKPAIDKNNNEPTTVPVVTKESVDGEKYSYVEYRGVRMPVEFVEIFNQAELDSKKACEEYGVAVEVGDRDISRSEFTMFYLDQYRLQMHEINYSIEQKGSNLTGYDPAKLPEEQQAVGVDYTFAEDFTLKAIEHIKTNYASFELALKDGTTLTESEIYSTILGYERVLEYAKYSQKEVTPDEYIQNVYGTGTTYAMFAAREIMQTYARIHEEDIAEKYREEVTLEEAEAKFKGNERKYKVILSRVYAIEGEYEAEEISLINTEEEFLEFVKKNHPDENYSADIKTLAYYVGYESIGKTYGYKVADWMFSEERVAGEVAVVRGDIYECLVYIEKPAFLDTSCDVMTYEFTYPEDQPEEAFNVMAEEVQALYDSWTEKPMTEEEFRKACLETGYGFERTYRSGDLFFMVNNWILDDSRKSGDISMYNDGQTVYITYYCHNNPDDFDWYAAIRNEISAERYLNEYNAYVDENCKTDRNERIIVQGQKAANVRINENIKKAKEEQ